MHIYRTKGNYSSKHSYQHRELFIICYKAVITHFLKSTSRFEVVDSRGYKFQSRSSTGQNMPKENELFTRSTFRTEHSINLTYF
jgi:hypothetical protein